jgi:cysteine desulfurase/selenocysteine lyase
MIAPTTFTRFDVLALRDEFPIMRRQINGRPLAFLDSAASSQKPRRVLDCLEDYYERYNSNVHRGVYTLSEEATFAYERARGKVAHFIGATSPHEVVFTRNTTEAINLVARAWGDANVRAGDHILLSVMEHHSNLVPWQMLAQRTGAQLDFLRIDDAGRLALEDLNTLLTERTKLVAITHQSNVLGTINPVREIAARAHAIGALMLVDGAQSVPHMPVDVYDLGADFLAFSGHKMCAPTGIGALWARHAILDAMPPFLGGGSMIKTVTLHESTYADVPARFEAGTPAIGEAIALGEAVDFLSELGMDNIYAHEQHLAGYALERLSEVAGLRLYGPHFEGEYAGESEGEMTSPLRHVQRGATLSFTLEGIHPHDVAALLDRDGIAVRAGHHCCQPLHALLDVPATTRASFYIYNIPEEVDRLVVALEKVRKLFA